MPVALVLIDALPPAYVSDATLPVIGALASDGFAGPLNNIYAFRGIEATLFTGLSPAEHGVWGEFRPAPAAAKRDRPLDRLTRLAISAGDLLPSDRLRLDARYVALRLLQSGQRISMGNLIPPELMPLFVSSIELPIWEHHSLGAIATIFDELRDAGRSFETVVYPAIRLDNQIVEYVRSRVGRGNLPDFWYIKFSALDALGHRYGPDVAKLAPALHELNEQFAALIATLQSAYPRGELDVVLISDHGMSRVANAIDVRPLLRRLGLTPGRDFLYFLDSTTIRFWSEDPRICDTLATAFSGVEGMSILDEAARRRLRLPNDSSTGDVLIALDEGWVVAPDFFRRGAPPLGMHGYAQVDTDAGLPFLAVGPAIAGLLPDDCQLGHADVWAAMRSRLGLEPEAVSESGEVLCTSLR